MGFDPPSFLVHHDLKDRLPASATPFHGVLCVSAYDLRGRVRVTPKASEEEKERAHRGKGLLMDAADRWTTQRA